MSTKLNRHGYEQLIAGDLDWLRGERKSLERDHVIQIVEDSVRMYYDVESQLAATTSALAEAVKALEHVKGFEHDHECAQAQRRCYCSAAIHKRLFVDRALAACRPLLKGDQ